jgi:tetratricopeptide (TPR) repeat protein
MPPAVSLCLITRDEEAALPACLGSAAGLFAEVVVVDAGSADRTREVAGGLGARVVDFPWRDHFAAARNESLRHAASPWVFWLDADERLDEPNRAALRALVAGLGDEPAAYVLRQRSASGDPDGNPTLADQVRLLPNRPDVRWSYRVHEQVLPALRAAGVPLRWTDIFVEHDGYVDPALRAKKTERNLRLLHLDDKDRPDDPFTLFNLGWAYLGLGRAPEAVPLLRRSLARSRPGDSIVRKLYVLLAQAHRVLGQRADALAACRAGRARHPDDAELLFAEAMLLREVGDRAGAEARLRQLVAAPRPETDATPGICATGSLLPVEGPQCFQDGTGSSRADKLPVAQEQSARETPVGRERRPEYFASLDAGLRGVRARHNLAVLLREQGRDAEAEAEWQAAVAERPAFAPAWAGLGELYLARGRWDDLERAAAALAARPATATEAAVLRARGRLARKEFAAARGLLAEVIAADPRALGPRVILTHVLLQEGADPAEAERALRAVLDLDPRQAESWRNLALLFRHHGRLMDAIEACRAGRFHRPDEPDLLLLLGLLLHEGGDAAGAEACFVQLLEEDSPAGGAAAARDRRAAARRRLAALARGRGRPAEAEAHWRAALAERPDLTADDGERGA